MVPKSRLLALALWSLLVPALTAHAESTAAKRVVAVLYFDNNTGDASLDVLQKGFADMMVTDLSSVQELQLVEREKLQQIIDEQKLQRSKYFDPKTSVRIGQLVGAQYTVAGSFLAMEPQLRIDIRLVENKTGGVIVGEQVTGLKNKLFDLQQQLVSRFVAGLQLKLSGTPRLRSRAPDLDTLLSYSKGIDLADQGKLQEASKQLAAVVSKAPAFLLARERHEQILERLKASEVKRADTLSEVYEALGRRAEEFLEAPLPPDADERASAMRLGYRQVRMQYLLHTLRVKHLAKQSPHVVLPGHEKQALALLQGWREQALAYIRESAEHFRRFHNVIDGAAYIGSTDLKLQPEDEERLRLARHRTLSYDDEAALGVAEFILMGKFRDGDPVFHMGPTLADQAPSAMKDGFRMLDQALEEAEASLPRQREFRTRRALELYGDAYMLRGQVEQAVARWQQFLDRHPTSDHFKYISNKIKTALGVGSNHYDNAGTQYNAHLATCDKSGILAGYSQEMNRRLITQGYKAAREMFLELDAKCGQTRELKPYLGGLLTRSGLEAANAGDCASFHALLPRYFELGGSKSDVEGYLKNYIPHCRPASEGAGDTARP
ncbi:CsgG/HfaB family protein [Hyalangium gracile]|uniref:CsgG/HfaB family protein n=1 Tax=Hyalangium gracile TaxID=394092 RepID=UPI001CCFD72B|nr:CsgG/HfaB family protein [Hyalangium gracile]